MSTMCVIDVENMVMSEIETLVAGIKLEPGRALGKADKEDLSHEAVWGITSAEGKPVVVVTTPVAKKFGCNLLYQNAPTSKPKIDFVVDSKLCDTTKMNKVFELLQARLTEVAVATIPVQSNNPQWKNKAAKVAEEMPKLLKLGKEFNRDGVSGRYDPSFTLSLKVPTENELKALDDKEREELESKIAAYEPPSAHSISTGYKDNIESYIGALRKTPPFMWGVKMKDPKGQLVDNDILLEKRTLVAQVIFELGSLMIKPLKQLSLQAHLRQMRICETTGVKRRIDDADLDALWKAPKTALAGSPPPAAAAPAAEASPDGAKGAADDDY
jgi:hypothetical protein